MRTRQLTSFAACLILAATTAQAAIRYEFRQTTNSEVEGMGSSNVVAKAVIDGERSRVDFIKGSQYKPGIYLISDGLRRMFVVDPAHKSYSEINIAQIATAIGASNISIANQKFDLKKLDDHPTIAGYKTDHYRLDMRYELTVTYGVVPLRQNVQTIIEKWTTMDLVEANQAILDQSTLQTGKPDLDAIIDAEMSKIKGFPLRELVTIITSSANQQRSGSQLKFKPTRQQQSDMQVMSIEVLDRVDNALFEVPAHFKRDTRSKEPNTDPINILNMEPATTTEN